MTNRLGNLPHSYTRDDLPIGRRDDFEMEVSENEDEDPTDLSHILGTSTGEQERDTVAGGWSGTDDATSTAPSDLDPTFTHGPLTGGPEQLTSPELAGGLGVEGAITDIKGTPVDESRDWETDPIVS